MTGSCQRFKIARVSRVRSPKNSTSVPPLTIPEFAAGYPHEATDAQGPSHAILRADFSANYEQQSASDPKVRGSFLARSTKAGPSR
jgi:hypothetical protein